MENSKDKFDSENRGCYLDYMHLLLFNPFFFLPTNLFTASCHHCNSSILPSSLAIYKVTLYLVQILLSFRLCAVASKAEFKLNQNAYACVSFTINMHVFVRVCSKLFQMICCISAPPLHCRVMSQPQPACMCICVCVCVRACHRN